MKKRIFIFTFLFFIFVPLFGNSKNTFSVSTGLGVITGNVKEFVYAEHVVTNKTIDLSMLDWEIVSVPYFFVDFETDLFKNLYLNLNGKIGIPVKSGKMQDYDWMNKVSSGQNGLTHYSIHDNYVSSYYSADLSIGFNFFLGENSIITPCVAVGANYISFDGKNGYRQYGNQIDLENFQAVYELWSDEITKIYFDNTRKNDVVISDQPNFDQNNNGNNNDNNSDKLPGEITKIYFDKKVISYNQTQTFFSFGCLSRLSVDNFDFNFSFFFSPIMAITSIDTHYLRNEYAGGTFFADIMEGFFYYGDASFLVKLNSFYKLGLKCEYSIVPKLYGYTLSKFVNSTDLWSSAGSGGTKRHFVQISLVNKFVF